MSGEKMSASDDRTYYIPTPADVLCGKGRDIQAHPGNKLFRGLVRSNLDTYSKLSDNDKQNISKLIVHEITKIRGGKFLKEDTTRCHGLPSWESLSFDKAVQKTSQAIRDQLRREKAKTSQAQPLHGMPSFPSPAFSNSPNAHRTFEDANEDFPSLHTFDPSSCSVSSFRSIREMNFDFHLEERKPVYFDRDDDFSNLTALQPTPLPDRQQVNDVVAMTSSSENRMSVEMIASQLSSMTFFNDFKSGETMSLCDASDYTPNDADVLCGKGRDIQAHPGNVVFRELVTKNLVAYVSASQESDKGRISKSIVDEIVTVHGGRFLKSDTPRDGRSPHWETLSSEEAVKKTSQAIRDRWRREKAKNLKMAHGI